MAEAPVKLRPVEYQEGQYLCEIMRCGQCQGRLIMPWGGSYGVNSYILRCARDLSHQTMVSPSDTRKLFSAQRGELVEVNVQDQTLAIPETGLAVMPPASLEVGLTQATLQHTENQLVLLEDYVIRVLRENEDYGTVPGISRQFLWKPGADNLLAAFTCHAEFEVMERVIDPQTGYIMYHHQCRAVHHQSRQVVEVGHGACNSYEVKYRYRNTERQCPSCHAATIRKSRRAEGGWYCWARIGGCGSQFPDGDQSIEGQVPGREENPDKMDLLNTIMKMSMKRSATDCAMRLPGVARFFASPRDAGEARDAEEDEEASTGAAPSRQPARPRRPRSADARRPQGGRGAHPAPTCPLHGLRMGLDVEDRWVHRTPEGDWCYGEAPQAPDLPVEGANEPDQSGPGEGPPELGLSLDTVFQLARECGYTPSRVPAILGSREHPITLPDFILAGGTPEEAMEKIRQYHLMDKGGVRS